METTGDRAPRWRTRFEEIDNRVAKIELPNNDHVDQDAEWCVAVVDGERQRVRFHDYDRIYQVPGFYESLFYETLKCTSPHRVATLLEDVLRDYDDELDDMKVLDVGAGNGMVGDELSARGADELIGIDIIPEAKAAAHRDRPGLYDDYLVTDLTDLPEDHEEQLRERKIDCLTTVAALGFGDIPPRAFIKALDVIETPAWLAFNIKEDFLREADDTGFMKLIRQLSRDEVIQVQAYRRYRHRLAASGRPLHYVAMVARKLRDVPDELLTVEA